MRVSFDTECIFVSALLVEHCLVAGQCIRADLFSTFTNVNAGE